MESFPPADNRDLRFCLHFPVTLLYFREVSVASPIANLLLVPICSLMLMLSLAIFLTGGVGIIAKPVCFCLKLAV